MGEGIGHCQTLHGGMSRQSQVLIVVLTTSPNGLKCNEPVSTITGQSSEDVSYETTLFADLGTGEIAEGTWSTVAIDASHAKDGACVFKAFTAVNLTCSRQPLVCKLQTMEDFSLGDPVGHDQSSLNPSCITKAIAGPRRDPEVLDTHEDLEAF
ncbi:hypothetical protein Tco_0280894 [Tanacetum coccineum]